MTELPSIDPKHDPVRPELAASRYQGRVQAERFVDAETYQVTAGVCSVRAAPTGHAEQTSQALFGEVVDIYEKVDGFGWGQMMSDSYVGWFDMAALSMPVQAPTHRITALRTYGFSEPSVKATPCFLLSMNAEVSADGSESGAFLNCGRAGWIAKQHLATIGTHYENDPVAVAERFINCPYQWGGKESLGLDCSGLVQMSYWACGIRLPRDSSHQKYVGEEVPLDALFSDLTRGDILCWPGHVALVQGPSRLIHANAHHMQTLVEPLAEAAPRIEAQDGPILTARRLLG